MANPKKSKTPPPASPTTRRPRYNYFFEERFEAGMVLEGWEVKSLREGKVQLTDGYVVIRDGELYVIGCQINPLRRPRPTSTPTRCAPRSCCCTRSRSAA